MADKNKIGKAGGVSEDAKAVELDAPGTAEAAEPETVAAAATAERRPAARRLARLLAMVLVAALGPVAVAAGGAYLYLTGGRFVSTDNAYVKSDKIAVSADVSGRVVEVAVRDNQVLGKGDELFRIEDEPFRIALAHSEAVLATARQEIEALRASYRQKLAELKLAEGDVGFYRTQFERQDKLNKKGYASQANLDTAARNLRNARDRAGAIKQDIAEALANLGGDVNIATAAHPRVRQAKAARDRARLDLRRTRVLAPTAGVVTNFDLQSGEYIEEGEAVFSLIGTGEVWVQANFKETDLTHVRLGQSAVLRIDTYPGQARNATVVGISPATGAEFALLPAQNASGNWVKVVQRLPVRLALDEAAAEPALRAGMSVVVEIDTGHERALPDLAQAALGWVRSLL